MARIGRDEYPKILRSVDVEGRKVNELAGEYGCSAANIYAILSKARRQEAETSDANPATLNSVLPVCAEANKVEGLPGRPPIAPSFNAPPPAVVSVGPASERQMGLAIETVPVAQHLLSAPPAETNVRGTLAATPTVPEIKPITTKSTFSGSKNKAGHGTAVALLMRTSDGDEAVHPFKTLEDLLSAAKPILRSAARSPEAIWFSIQEVDLASVRADEF